MRRNFLEKNTGNHITIQNNSVSSLAAGADLRIDALWQRRWQREGRAGGGRLFVAVEDGEIGSGKAAETAGLR